MRHAATFVATMGMILAVPATAAPVSRAQVVNGAQWYLDNEGACFRITADGDVRYNTKVDCRTAPPAAPPVAPAGAILGGVAGNVVNGRQYYRDTRGYCYYVDQQGNPHYDYDTRC